MSQWDKLLHQLSLLSCEFRFAELEKILKKYGYTMREPKGGSSHVTFRKKGCSPITIPRHARIKRVYVEMVRAVVEKEAEHEDD